MNKFTCFVCDSDNWQSLDYLRQEKLGFVICRECGIQSYHPAFRKYKTEENLLDFYRYEYRRHPNAENIITSNRKLGYLIAFFGDLLEKNKGWKVLDIGSATGYFLSHLKAIGYDIENLYGSEYTHSFRHFSKNFYGLKHVNEEVPKDKEFDFILLNHVLEHMHEPDKKLLQYKDMLSDGGYISIWVPYWHEVCFDFAKRVVESFEDYFHVNHINTWTEDGFKNLLNKVGLKVVRESKQFYGLSVLCQKGESLSILKEDYKEIIESTEKQKDAILLHRMPKPQNQKAIERFGKYPDAITGLVFYDNKSDFQKQKELLTMAINNMPFILELKGHLAHVLWQWKHYNESLELCVEYLKKRPNDDIMYEQMARCFVEMGNWPNAVGALNKAAQLNPARWVMVQDMVGNIMSRDWTKPSVNIIKPIANKA